MKKSVIGVLRTSKKLGGKSERISEKPSEYFSLLSFHSLSPTPDFLLNLDENFWTFSIVAFKIMKPWLQYDPMLGKDQESGKCNVTRFAVCELTPVFPSVEGRCEVE